LRLPVLALGLVAAAAATGGAAFLVLRRGETRSSGPRADAADEAGTAASPISFRPAPIERYQTTLTLAEDLRDALAGDPEALAAECGRVAAAIAPRARYTLAKVAPAERSPRVRALLVLAAGMHVADEPLLLDFLSDPAAIVRRAAAVAAGHDATGTRHETLLPGLDVPLGSVTSPEVRSRLEAALGREEDAAVRATVAAVLAGGAAEPGVSPPR